MTGFPRVSSPHTPRFPAPRPPFWRRGGCGRGPRRRGGVAWPGVPRARFLRGGRPGPGPCAHSFGMDFAAAASSHSQRHARARRPPPPASPAAVRDPRRARSRVDLLPQPGSRPLFLLAPARRRVPPDPHPLLPRPPPRLAPRLAPRGPLAWELCRGPPSPALPPVRPPLPAGMLR